MLKGESDEDGKGGRALAVQDINAPAEYVWDRILDFGTYNKMVGVSHVASVKKNYSSLVPLAPRRLHVREQNFAVNLIRGVAVWCVY